MMQDQNSSSSSSPPPPSQSQVKTTIIPSTHNVKTYKIIVIGDSGVGKTCLTYRFCDKKFTDTSEVTIGIDFRERILNIEGEPIKLQLWDTAGQERYRTSIVQHYYRKTDAVILVYDVTSMKSFESLKQWLDECELNGLKHVPKIMVGNKCDQECAVNTQLAQRFADEYYMPLFETSARLDSQFDIVESIFITLAHKLKSEKPFMKREDTVKSLTNSVPTESSNCSC